MSFQNRFIFIESHKPLMGHHLHGFQKAHAKLGYCGSAKLLDCKKGYKTTDLARTLGHICLETIRKGKASKKFDVYSFGIVAL